MIWEREEKEKKKKPPGPEALRFEKLLDVFVQMAGEFQHVDGS